MHSRFLINWFGLNFIDIKCLLTNLTFLINKTNLFTRNGPMWTMQLLRKYKPCIVLATALLNRNDCFFAAGLVDLHEIVNRISIPTMKILEVHFELYKMVYINIIWKKNEKQVLKTFSFSPKFYCPSGQVKKYHQWYVIFLPMINLHAKNYSYNFLQVYYFKIGNKLIAMKRVLNKKILKKIYFQMNKLLFIQN